MYVLQGGEIKHSVIEQLDFVFGKTTDVLLNVFLKNYTNAQGRENKDKKPFLCPVL